MPDALQVPLAEEGHKVAFNDAVAGFASFLLLEATLFILVVAANFLGTTLPAATFFVATLFTAVFWGADFLVAGFFVASLDFAAFFALVTPFPSPRQSITLSNTCQPKNGF